MGYSTGCLCRGFCSTFGLSQNQTTTMKKLILLTALALSIYSCKKGDSINATAAATATTYAVRYDFRMEGTPANLTYLTAEDSKTVKVSGIVTQQTGVGIYPAYVVYDHVKIGDHIHLEMTTPKKISGMIDIALLKTTSDGGSIDPGITSVSTGTTDNLGSYTIVIDKTFTAVDFNY
jgi:hypothetical protein